MTSGKSPLRRVGILLLHHPMEIILALMILVLTFSAPGFATLGNLLSVLRTISMLGIIAFGMTAVIIAGEIDLSIGSGVALAGCIVAWFAGALTDPLGPLAAVIIGAAAAIAVGTLLGYATGLVRHWFNVPTFITTLGLLAGLRGTANLITGGFPLTTFPGWFDFFGGGYLFFVPFPVYIFAATFLAMFFLMNYTRFGRSVYAVGGNMEAARLSGIDIWAVKSATLAITGGLTAVSGILIASLIGSGTGTTATGMELDVIAATIIGGTSLFGGKGRIGGTLIGVLFLGVISNGMTLLDVNEYWQYVARGAIILVAVLINQVLERAR
jgi:sugar transport system permease protein